MALLSTVIARGLASARPASAAAGALYYSTDSGVLERYSGSAWQSYSATGGFAPLVHTHAAADVTSGTLAVARLGSGSASASTYLRGDGAWAVLPPGTIVAKHILTTPESQTMSTTLQDTTSKYTIPSADMVVGANYRLRARGTVNNTTGGNRTSDFQLRLAGTTVATILGVSAPQNVVTGFEIRADMTILTVGSSGTAEVGMSAEEGSSIVTAAVAINTTVARTINFAHTDSTTNVGVTVRFNIFTVERMVVS